MHLRTVTCLYNSISFLLQGDEFANDRLRRKTARELEHNLDVYVEAIEKLSVEVKMSFKITLLNILDETSVDHSTGTRKWIKNDIQNTYKTNTWSGALQFMALATVLQLPITSVWPANTPGERIQHRIFYPLRQADDQAMKTLIKDGQDQELIVFWAKTFSAKTPNHIVPVAKKSRVAEQNPHTAAPSVWRGQTVTMEIDYNAIQNNKISDSQQTGKGKGKKGKKGKKQKFTTLCSFGSG